MKSLQEQISVITRLMGILQENKDLAFKRRLTQLDAIISYTLKYELDSYGCNEIDDMVEVVIDKSIEHFYYDYFGDVDDSSTEWEELGEKIEYYIITEWGDRIREHIEKNCR